MGREKGKSLSAACIPHLPCKFEARTMETYPEYVTAAVPASIFGIVVSFTCLCLIPTVTSSAGLCCSVKGINTQFDQYNACVHIRLNPPIQEVL